MASGAWPIPVLQSEPYDGIVASGGLPFDPNGAGNDAAAFAAAWGSDMIVLLAAGVGVCVVGLLAIGFSVPISDTSFGNALTIGGVVIVCTGIVLIGMSFVARELAKLTRLVGAQGVSAARPTVSPRPAMPTNPFAVATGDAATDGIDDRAAPASPPPWAQEVATRARPRPSAPEIPPVEPVVAPPPPAPDRPARRNLLFSTKRHDKVEPEPPAAAREAEPKVSFEDAWPHPLRPNGAAEPHEPSIAPAGNEAAAVRPAAPPPPTADAPKTPGTDLPPGVTVVRSGTVDEMAYTYYSDGSIEAQLAGESPIRFASLDELRTYVEQRK